MRKFFFYFRFVFRILFLLFKSRWHDGTSHSAATRKSCERLIRVRVGVGVEVEVVAAAAGVKAEAEAAACNSSHCL